MKKHRITEVDLYGSLRAAGIFNICEIEAVILGELHAKHSQVAKLIQCRTNRCILCLSLQGHANGLRKLHYVPSQYVTLIDKGARRSQQYKRWAKMRSDRRASS